jgi:predicted Zn-dependent protease
LAALEPYKSEGSRPILLLSTQASLAVPNADNLPQRAAELQTWVAVNPRDSLAWTALSQVEERLGQPLRAVRADAESRVALGDLQGAIDRLQSGQRRARGGGTVDFIDASVIDARLRDISVLRKQQRDDEKDLK